VWRWDNQEPFGNDTPNGDPGNTGTTFDFPLRLPGQYFDRETNLAYNYFRDYDPSIGRYVESDPVGLTAGLNTYSYVRASPLRSVDPLGLLVNDGTCSARRWLEVKQAEHRIEQVADKCVECRDRERFKELLRVAVVGCVASNDFPPRPSLQVDAFTRPPGGFALTPGGLSPQIGCLEATIVHEITHLVGYQGEAVPIRYEKACFTCAPDRPAP